MDAAPRSQIAGQPRAHGAARAVVACVAVFALYLQLLATVACMGGVARATAFGPAAGSFPICHHAQAVDASVPQAPSGHDTPDHQQPGCPFCALHCHAMIATAQVAGITHPALLEWASADFTASVAEPAPLFRAVAYPRGPPVAL